MAKIKNLIFTAEKDLLGPFKIPIKKGNELHIVEDVVYMEGNPVDFSIQEKLYNWLVSHNDFTHTIRNF